MFLSPVKTKQNFLCQIKYTFWKTAFCNLFDTNVFWFSWINMFDNERPASDRKLYTWTSTWCIVTWILKSCRQRRGRKGKPEINFWIFNKKTHRFIKASNQWNIDSFKHRIIKTSNQWNIESVKHRIIKTSNQWNIDSLKHRIIKTSNQWNIESLKHWIDGTQRWQRMQDGFDAASPVKNNFWKLI